MSVARVRAVAPAKLNLWLRVFGRDAKGYHALESLFQLLGQQLPGAGQAELGKGLDGLGRGGAGLDLTDDPVGNAEPLQMRLPVCPIREGPLGLACQLLDDQPG